MEGQKPETKSDEIDLGQLFSRIGSGFRSGWLNFMRFLADLRRIPLQNKILFVLIIAASIVVGIAYSTVVRKNYYESKMILSSDYLNKRLAENIIDKLNALASESNKHGLAITLGIDDSVANKINSFDITEFMAETDIVELEVLKEQLRAAATTANKKVIDQVIERIEIENRHAFEITVRTSHPSVVSTLEKAIVGYFRNNPYISKRVEINERNLNDLKNKLSRDIGKLDSIKLGIYESYKQMATQSKGSNNVILGEKVVADPVEIFTQSIDIYDLYEDVNSDLFTRRDFEIIDGFTQLSEPSNTRKSEVVLVSILIGIVVAYLLVALSRFNRYLANLQ